MALTSRQRGAALIAGLLAASMLGAPVGVTAKDGDIIRRGSCSAGSSWKLKLSPENGRIEVELEVDQNRSGQTWNVKLKRDGSTFWRGQRMTRAPSGSFELRRVTGDGAGQETIVARARDPRSGEVCRGVATFRG